MHVPIEGHVALHKNDEAFTLDNGRFSTDDGDVKIIIIEPGQTREDCYVFKGYKKLCRSRRNDNVLCFLKKRYCSEAVQIQTH